MSKHLHCDSVAIRLADELMLDEGRSSRSLASFQLARLTGYRYANPDEQGCHIQE